MTTVEVLKAARARIEKGWIQGHPHTEEGWCVTGSFMGLHGNLIEGCACCLAQQKMCMAIGTAELVRWNDAPGRTQAEVLAAFDKAIALAEKETA